MKLLNFFGPDRGAAWGSELCADDLSNRVACSTGWIVP